MLENIKARWRLVIHFFVFILIPACSQLPWRESQDQKDLLTLAETSNYTETSRHADVLQFLDCLAARSPFIRIENLARSTEGRNIPLAILGKPLPARPEDAGKRAVVFIMANIHAGEVEGKEAVQILMRQILAGELGGLLEHLVILIAPNFNADGNEKVSTENRPWQGGPEGGVGHRYNGQNLDLNRDFIKLECPETQGLVEQVLNRWDPLVIVDCHTTNGSVQKAEVCYSGTNNPFCHPQVRTYLWDKLFPAVTRQVTEQEGYTFVPYGFFKNFTKPEQGWRTFGAEPRYSTNYLALRNRFSILDENYAYKDFKTRISACRAFLQAILEYTLSHREEMMEIAALADRETVEAGRELGGKYRLPLEVEVQPLKKPIQVHSYRMEAYTDQRGRRRPRKTDEERIYSVPYLARFVPSRTIPVPAGYLLPPALRMAEKKLLQHGIRIRKLSREVKAEVEVFRIDELKAGSRLRQGHWNTSLEGTRKVEERSFPAGSLYVGIDQPLGRLAVYLLEAESTDSLVSWNFVDRHLLRSQWSGKAGEVPIYRVLKPLDLAFE